jgi:ABC-type sugar transport system ATPase subunit
VADVVLRKVVKRFDEVEAVRGIDLHIPDKEFVVLVGPSGCGKSTTLRMIAGLESITAGVLRIGDRVVNEVAARDRDIAMVFQNYALYPHMSVYDNIAFGLRMRGLHRREIDKLASQVAERGLTLVPTRLYFKDGRAKVELALARGKEGRDKRRDIAERETKRRLERELKSRR